MFGRQQRRHFIIGTAGFVAGAVSARQADAADEHAAIRELIERYYSVYYKDRDKAGYRALVTDDYLLLEHGELLTLEQDIALMPAADSNYRRTDAFAFKLIAIDGATAYAVYHLTSDISDEKGPRHRLWLESAILKRSGSGAAWRVALLHSTRIEKPA